MASLHDSGKGRVVVEHFLEARECEALRFVQRLVGSLPRKDFDKCFPSCAHSLVPF